MAYKLHIISGFIALLILHGTAVCGQVSVTDLGPQVQHADIIAPDLNFDGYPDILLSGKGGTAFYLGIDGSAFNLQPEAAEAVYSNPLFEPDLADPTIIRAADKWFYAYGTENTWDDGHKLVPVIRSADLVNWAYVGEAFQARPAWKDGGVWAPEIALVDGKYYLYYALSTWGDPNPGIGLAIADQPEGPFIDYGKVLDSESTGVSNSIDPTLFIKDGLKYLVWGSLGGGIHMIELSHDGKRIIGSKKKLAGGAFEAAYIYPKNGYYYLFVSTGTCCDGSSSQYRVVVGRSENFDGPFLTRHGVDLMQYNYWWSPDIDNMDGIILLGNSAIAGPGHNGQIITDDRGDDWFIYHAIERSDPLLPGGATRRPLFMDKIAWQDGWPVLNMGNGPSYENRPIPIFNQ